jgi:hypothetical protein
VSNERQFALDAASQAFCNRGIDIACPWDGDLSDEERERFDAMVAAIDAYNSVRRSPTEARGEPVDDPDDEKWNAGVNFAITQLCEIFGIEPRSMSWDAATETVDGDVSSVLCNVLRAAYGENWSSNGRDTARILSALSHPPAREAVDEEMLFRAMEDECWDLRCVEEQIADTGDADIAWVVIGHYMAKPGEREIARASSPRAALRAALQVKP